MLQQIGAEQRVCIAADRILLDAQRGAEHASLAEHAGLRGLQRKQEIAGRADTRRQRRQARVIRARARQHARLRYAEQHARAALTCDRTRAARVQICTPQPQGLEHQVQLSLAQPTRARWGRLADRNARRADGKRIDLNDCLLYTSRCV